MNGEQLVKSLRNIYHELNQEEYRVAELLYAQIIDRLKTSTTDVKNINNDELFDLFYYYTEIRKTIDKYISKFTLISTYDNVDLQLYNHNLKYANKMIEYNIILYKIIINNFDNNTVQFDINNKKIDRDLKPIVSYCIGWQDKYRDMSYHINILDELQAIKIKDFLIRNNCYGVTLYKKHTDYEIVQ